LYIYCSIELYRNISINVSHSLHVLDFSVSFGVTSLALQGPEQIHVSKFYKESKNGKFVSYITENVRTLYQTFREGAYASNNGPCLGWRETLTSPYQVR